MFMNVYKCIWMYMNVYECICTCVYECIYMVYDCMCVYVWLYVFIYPCMNTVCMNIYFVYNYDCTYLSMNINV